MESRSGIVRSEVDGVCEVEIGRGELDLDCGVNAGGGEESWIEMGRGDMSFDCGFNIGGGEVDVATFIGELQRCSSPSPLCQESKR